MHRAVTSPRAWVTSADCTTTKPMAPSLGCARRRLRQVGVVKLAFPPVTKSVSAGHKVRFRRSHGLLPPVTKCRFACLFFPVFGPMNSFFSNRIRNDSANLWSTFYEWYRLQNRNELVVEQAGRGTKLVPSHTLQPPRTFGTPLPPPNGLRKRKARNLFLHHGNGT